MSGQVARGLVEPYLNLSLAAEALDHRELSITGGRPGAEYKAQLRDGNGLLCVVGAYRLALKAATGGAEVTATAKPTLVFTLDDDGAAVLDIHDVAGGTNTTIHCELEPHEFSGPTQRKAVLFDAVDSSP